MNAPDPMRLINASRHYLGQAALNILLHPDDLARIDHDIEQATQCAKQFRASYHESVMPEEWQRLTNEGRLIKALRAQFHAPTELSDKQQHPNSSVAPTHLAKPAPANMPTSTAPAEEPHTDGNILCWSPTSDHLGYIAQHGDTVYTIHTIGRPKSWTWGVGDGSQTAWQQDRFPSEELARNAAQHHLDQATNAQTENKPTPAEASTPDVPPEL